jgi:hypothetical protein
VLSYGDIATSNSPRLPSANRHTFETMSRTHGAFDAHVGLVRNHVSRHTTSSPPRAVQPPVSPCWALCVCARRRGAPRGRSDKVLAVLDGVLCADAVLEAARGHALVATRHSVGEEDVPRA